MCGGNCNPLATFLLGLCLVSYLFPPLAHIFYTESFIASLHFFPLLVTEIIFEHPAFGKSLSAFVVLRRFSLDGSHRTDAPRLWSARYPTPIMMPPPSHFIQPKFVLISKISLQIKGMRCIKIALSLSLPSVKTVRSALTKSSCVEFFSSISRNERVKPEDVFDCCVVDAHIIGAPDRCNLLNRLKALSAR